MFAEQIDRLLFEVFSCSDMKGEKKLKYASIYTSFCLERFKITSQIVMRKTYPSQ